MPIITVNGCMTKTPASTLYDFYRERYMTGTTVLVNGCPCSDNMTLKDGDDITFVTATSVPSQEDIITGLCRRHTQAIQEKLSKADITVAGLGGLGSHIAVHLCRSGIGTLRLYDFDKVDLCNLNRQSYFISDIGSYKTEALANQLHLINPYLKIYTKTIRLTQNNIPSLCSSSSIVIEAFDDPKAKALLVNTILSELEETTVISASGMSGYGRSNDIRTRRISSRLYVCGDETPRPASGGGLMSARVAICAAHEANLAIQLCIEKEP